MDKTVIFEHMCSWLRMLNRMEVKLPEGLAIPSEFNSGNPYSVQVFATGTHRLLVQNPDPADAVQVATWHGVRLNVHMWRPSSERGQGGGWSRPTAQRSGVANTLAEFPVMLDQEAKKSDFLWQLLTACLPFEQWACVTLTIDKTTYHYHQKHPTSQIWPSLVKEYFGPRDRREHRVVNTDASEFAARSGLEDVQDMAWGVTKHSKYDDARTMRGERDASWDFNTYSEEWTIDIRAKTD
jgi:hypothetical protein